MMVSVDGFVTALERTAHAAASNASANNLGSLELLRTGLRCPRLASIETLQTATATATMTMRTNGIRRLWKLDGIER
jgi:hypothetical protein